MDKLEESNSLITNKTWDEVPETEIPDRHTALSGKWVFKLKRGVTGEIIRYKACHVVKGYLQQYDIDFDQTLEAVVKPMAIRALFAFAAYYDLDVEQIDITAFLDSIIKLIFVTFPPGYEKPGMVRKLRKGLWPEAITTPLVRANFRVPIRENGPQKATRRSGIFATEQGVHGPMIIIWVDDLNLFTPRGPPWMQRMKDMLAAGFKMVDMGLISCLA